MDIDAIEGSIDSVSIYEGVQASEEMKTENTPGPIDVSLELIVES